MKHNLNHDLITLKKCNFKLNSIKKLFIFCIFCISQVLTNDLYAQNASITLNLDKTTLKTIFSEIEKQSDYVFLVTGDVKKELNKILDIHVTNQSVDKVLSTVLENSTLSFSIVEKQISIYKEKNNKASGTVTKTPQQTINRVTGKVSEVNGTSIPGVTITVKNTPRGVFTDSNGQYSIEAHTGEKLLFSFIGFENEIIDVKDSKVENVTLIEKAALLNEVQVVAFGKQKKESVISSISTIRPSELKVPSSNLTTALAGRVAGIISYQRSGEPGLDNADFFIRGVTTFGYTKSPLILIDGLEVTSSDLARLQPDDIESFSIMKDATAAALYGARGANGVILVTTKEGEEGKVKVSVRYESSLSSTIKDINLADPITYMNLHNESVSTRDPLGILPYSQEKIENTAKGLNPMVYPATDWYKLLFNDETLNSRINFNVGGGGKVARYYIAGTYNIDNGNLKVDRRNNFNNNIKLNRYMLRSNVNINITPTTEAVVRLYGTFDHYTGPMSGGKDIYSRVMRTNPVLFPAYYTPDANNIETNHILFGNYDKGDYINPYSEMIKGYKEYTTSTLITQFEASQKLDFITKGLKIRGLFSTTSYSYFDVSRYYNPFFYSVGGYDKQTKEYSLVSLNPTGGTEYLNYAEGSKNINSKTYMEVAIDYTKTINKDHEVGGLLVYYQSERLNANAGTLQLSLPFRNLGLSGRVTYGYKSKYFLEGAFGYNGSERFAAKNRFGFFPSIGGGWIASNESFYPEDLKLIIPKLKLKMTLGKVGNDAIGSDADRFFYLSNINMSDGYKAYTFGSEFQNENSGIGITRYENAAITWETSTKANLGLEMNFFSMIDFNIDVYKEDRTNILLTRSNIPSTFGLQARPQTNVGEAEARGLEFSLDVNKVINKDLWITGRFNFTYSKSKFLVYDEPDYSATPWKSRIGQPLAQSWGYVAERLFVDEEEVENSPTQFGDTKAGDIKYKDINGDYEINELDQVPIGYPTSPEIVYGFGLSAGYKGLDLSCFFQGLANESFWIDANATAPFVDTDGNGSIKSQNALLEAYAEDHWSESNRNLYALWPRLSATVSQNNTQTSTWFMRNGSFLRLKSLEAGYTIPSSLTKRMFMSKLRFYVSGTNLLTFSAFKLWDPEMAGNGLGYPVQKVINFGLQVSF